MPNTDPTDAVESTVSSMMQSVQALGRLQQAYTEKLGEDTPRRERYARDKRDDKDLSDNELMEYRGAKIRQIIEHKAGDMCQDATHFRSETSGGPLTICLARHIFSSDIDLESHLKDVADDVREAIERQQWLSALTHKQYSMSISDVSNLVIEYLRRTRYFGKDELPKSFIKDNHLDTMKHSSLEEMSETMKGVQVQPKYRTSPYDFGNSKELATAHVNATLCKQSLENAVVSLSDMLKKSGDDLKGISEVEDEKLRPLLYEAIQSAQSENPADLAKVDCSSVFSTPGSMFASGITLCDAHMRSAMDSHMVDVNKVTLVIVDVGVEDDQDCETLFAKSAPQEHPEEI